MEPCQWETNSVSSPSRGNGCPHVLPAVADDPWPGKDHVGMGGAADLDRFDHLDQVHAVALREEAPFV